MEALLGFPVWKDNDEDPVDGVLRLDFQDVCDGKVVSETTAVRLQYGFISDPGRFT